MQHSVPLRSAECRQSSNLGGRDALSYRALQQHSRFCVFFFPFGTPVMSCCDDVDRKRSGCWRPVTGPAPPRALRRYAAPCPASPPFPNCWSPPPARAVATSCCRADSPFAGPASLFCLYSLPARSCARCPRRRRGTPCALCFES